MKRGIDVSTIVLVAFLLGILILVGRVVNPPAAKGDHDHESEGSAQSAPPPKPQAPMKGAPKMPGRMTAQDRDQMGKGMPPGAPSRPSTPPKAAAHTPPPDTMDPTLWQQQDMGTVTPKPDAKK